MLAMVLGIAGQPAPVQDRWSVGRFACSLRARRFGPRQTVFAQLPPTKTPDVAPLRAGTAKVKQFRIGSE